MPSARCDGVRIAVGDGTPVAMPNSTLLPLNWVEIIAVTPGQKIAVLGSNRDRQPALSMLHGARELMRTEILLDRTERKIIVVTEQDVEPILERNKPLRSQPQEGDWGRHIATIPNVILVKWLNEEHARGNVQLRMFSKEFDALVAQKLSDPDWAYLRTD